MVVLGVHCTFEVGSDAGIISWRLPHELVQEVWRRQLRSCPAGGLYLLLTGAQSDITRGKGGKVGNKCKEKEKEKERKIWETAVEECVCIRGSSGGGGEKNNENQNKKPTAIAKSVISRKYPAVDEEMRVKNDEWTACLSWQLKAYLSHIMSETYCGC